MSSLRYAIRPNPSPLLTPSSPRPRPARSPGWLRSWLTIALIVASARHSAAGAASGLARDLDAALSRMPRSAQVGLVVADEATGTVLYEHDGDRPLKPASVAKLFVTAAALERLGADFAFQTPVFLAGDELCVCGSGDPGIGDERLAERAGRSREAWLDQIAAALRARGMQKIARVVLDDSIFDEQWTHPDWPADQADRWYQAPVGGLNLNDNCVDVRLLLRGGQVQVVSQPPLPDVFFDARVRPGRSQKVTLRRDPGRDIFVISGTIRGETEIEPASICQPTVVFGHALTHALRQRGIEITGDPVARGGLRARAEEAAPLVVLHTSLPEVIWRCNTFSQNFFAECLSKALAAYRPARSGRRPAGASEVDAVPPAGAAIVLSGHAGNWAEGTELTRRGIAELGVPVDGLELRDGSGLSHRNRATARQIVQLLLKMGSGANAEVWKASLARAGEDGSMRRKFGAPEFRGRFIGKTGSIAGVDGLAGYVTRCDGRHVVFALLVNGASGDALEQRVVRILLNAEGER